MTGDRWRRIADQLEDLDPSLSLGRRVCTVAADLLACRTLRLGALNLFAGSPIRDEELVVAQALADAVTIALLQADPHEDAVLVTRRLHVVVEERNTIEQAKGVISQRFNVDAEAAFTQLRLAGERTGTRLIDVAISVVNRDSSYDAARLLEVPIE